MCAHHRYVPSVVVLQCKLRIYGMCKRNRPTFTGVSALLPTNPATNTPSTSRPSAIELFICRATQTVETNIFSIGHSLTKLSKDTLLQRHVASSYVEVDLHTRQHNDGKKWIPLCLSRSLYTTTPFLPSPCFRDGLSRLSCRISGPLWCCSRFDVACYLRSQPSTRVPRITLVF